MAFRWAPHWALELRLILSLEAIVVPTQADRLALAAARTRVSVRGRAVANFGHAIAGSEASSMPWPFALSATSMLPRVAFEYGHTW
jgi:hypothetical protein